MRVLRTNTEVENTRKAGMKEVTGKCAHCQESVQVWMRGWMVEARVACGCPAAQDHPNAVIIPSSALREER